MTGGLEGGWRSRGHSHTRPPLMDALLCRGAELPCDTRRLPSVGDRPRSPVKTDALCGDSIQSSEEMHPATGNRKHPVIQTQISMIYFLGLLLIFG